MPNRKSPDLKPWEVWLNQVWTQNQELRQAIKGCACRVASDPAVRVAAACHQLCQNSVIRSADTEQANQKIQKTLNACSDWLVNRLRGSISDEHRQCIWCALAGINLAQRVYSQKQEK